MNARCMTLYVAAVLSVPAGNSAFVAVHVSVFFSSQHGISEEGFFYLCIC